MKTKCSLVLFAAGMLLGTALTPAAHAVTEHLTATRSVQPIYVDGSQVSMEAYTINGANYVKLRDVGKALGFNVYWDGSAVQVDSTAPYTGDAPKAQAATITLPPHKRPTSSVTIEEALAKTDAFRQEIVERTNAVRIANGLPALPTDPMLMKAAQVRAEEMAATGCYSHTRPDGTSRSTVTDCKWTSENIHQIWQSNLNYKGIGLAELCVNEWVASPGHLQNMTCGDSTAMGVGVAPATDRFGDLSWYCVQWFIGEGYEITWVDDPLIP